MRLPSRLQQSDRARNVPGWPTGARAAHLRLKPRQAGAGERHGPVPAHPVTCPVVAVQPQALLVQCDGPVEVTRAPGRRPQPPQGPRRGPAAGEFAGGLGQRGKLPVVGDGALFVTGQARGLGQADQQEAALAGSTAAASRTADASSNWMVACGRSAPNKQAVPAAQTANARVDLLQSHPAATAGRRQIDGAGGIDDIGHHVQILEDPEPESDSGVNRPLNGPSPASCRLVDVVGATERTVFAGQYGHYRSRQLAGRGFRMRTAEQHEPERWGDHHRQQPGSHQACRACA
jgi:hypothetical protein